MSSNSKLQTTSETGNRQRLDLRSRRTIAANGSESTEYSVFCPVRGRSLSLSDCKACDLCGGTSVDPLERNSFVLCAGEPRPSTAWQPTPLTPRVQSEQAILPPVSTIMTKNVLCVRADVSVQELTLLLFEYGVSGLPVVDAQGGLVGIVSNTDLLQENYDRAELEQEESALPPHIPEATVAETMTRGVLSLPESASVHEAAALMALEGVHRLPILDDEDRVIGIVSAGDVLTWLAREAGYVVPTFPKKGRPR